MKRALTVSVVLCGLLMFVGCEETKTNKYEETMKEYAISYYNAHQKGTEGTTTVPVSIAKLKDAIEKVGDTYDMSKLEACTDDSYVELIINPTTNDVDSVNYYMNCGE